MEYLKGMASLSEKNRQPGKELQQLHTKTLCQLGMRRPPHA